MKTFQSGKRAGGRWSVHEKRYLLRGVGRVHRQPIDIAVATVSLQLKAPSKGCGKANSCIPQVNSHTPHASCAQRNGPGYRVILCTFNLLLLWHHCGLRPSQVQITILPKLFGASGCHASQCGQHQGCLGKDHGHRIFSHIRKLYI